MLNVKSFFHEDTNTISHVIWDEAAKACAVIDPVLDFDPESQTTATESASGIADFVKSQGLACRYILETHVHADHLSACQFIRELLGGKIAVSKNIHAVQEAFCGLLGLDLEKVQQEADFDLYLEDGDELALGDTTIKVMACPGHTPACVIYVADGAAFVGDTIFMPDSGTARCDFPGGDAATLYRSIQKLFALPDSTMLYMCHDYGAGGAREISWQTTVAEEKSSNSHVGGGTAEADYVKTREARDATLSEPRLLWPSIQVNMRAGHVPEKILPKP